METTLDYYGMESVTAVKSLTTESGYDLLKHFCCLLALTNKMSDHFVSCIYSVH